MGFLAMGKTWLHPDVGIKPREMSKLGIFLTTLVDLATTNLRIFLHRVEQM